MLICRDHFLGDTVDVAAPSAMRDVMAAVRLASWDRVANSSMHRDRNRP